MYYFEDIKEQEKLLKEINEWLGTPYRHRCMVKRKGVDCIHFIAGVYTNINAISAKLKYPEYDSDWHLHNSEELLYNYIKKNIKVDDISLNSKLMNGDILLYKFGKACAHASLYFDNCIYHALLGTKVIKSIHKDRMWYRRLTYILRLKK